MWRADTKMTAQWSTFKTSLDQAYFFRLSSVLPRRPFNRIRWPLVLDAGELALLHGLELVGVAVAAAEVESLAFFVLVIEVEFQELSETRSGFNVHQARIGQIDGWRCRRLVSWSLCCQCRSSFWDQHYKTYFAIVDEVVNKGKTLTNDFRHFMVKKTNPLSTLNHAT